MTSRTALALVVIGGGVVLLWRARSTPAGLLADPAAWLDSILPNNPVPIGAGQTPAAAAAKWAATMPTNGPGNVSVSKTSAVVGQTATGAGLAVTAAALAPGALSAAAVAIPLIGAGVALLSYGIVEKGLFRGGEEGVKVNPARDAWLRQFGPPSSQPGVIWEQSGNGRLAALLTRLTNEPDGSHYWQALAKADTMSAFKSATADIANLLAGQGIQIAA